MYWLSSWIVWCCCASVTRSQQKKLPVWLRIIATTRPHLKDVFRYWSPTLIEPQQPENLQDLHQLISCCLPTYLAQGGELQAASQVVLDKSGVSAVCCGQHMAPIGKCVMTVHTDMAMLGMP